ncbi:hypothetical protein HBH70_238340 [Parastagonospora nodorum]|nr:hypothetical protein HBI09_131660 [Parastagonospora nodorum]KAH4047792.1 hypothetical protein HBH49_169770 [Parastagonospora nodorum]KAH4055859.1 hypothetical protein HBH50_244100 [Parastagonospora nodorum]KAH4077378.1 hypothetical protein HBH48_242960 [Parastagonospora nodorum]KAH4080220.1 hypothetical protein HBH46_231100 [Parastagonospora nodorum]
MPIEKTGSNIQAEKEAAMVEAWRSTPLGYPRLSERMGLKPETLIFRKFVALNARILLYMQAELVDLERALQKQEERDLNDKDGKRSRYASDFSYLPLSHKYGDTTQLQLVKNIQVKLEVYNKALIQQYKVNQIPGPDRFDLDDMQALLISDAMDRGVLTGNDATIWGHPDTPNIHAPDLIGLCQREDVDTFSRIVSRNAIFLFNYGLGRIKKADHHLGNVYYGSSVLNITKWITSILASMLPVASILVLSKLQARNTKLGVLVAFNFVFTVCLTVCTKAKRAEVFAITAAFAAVQVVFIGTDNSTSPAPCPTRLPL